MSELLVLLHKRSEESSDVDVSVSKRMESDNFKPVPPRTSFDQHLKRSEVVLLRVSFVLCISEIESVSAAACGAAAKFIYRHIL